MNTQFRQAVHATLAAKLNVNDYGYQESITNLANKLASLALRTLKNETDYEAALALIPFFEESGHPHALISVESCALDCGFIVDSRAGDLEFSKIVANKLARRVAENELHV